MQTLQYRSLHDCVNQYHWQLIAKPSLLISDIDGVFFKGIFDPREIVGLISKPNLLALKSLLIYVQACWILSNRWGIFRYFPFIRQIRHTIKEVTTVQPLLYSNCSSFLKAPSPKYSIILNAKKPSKESQQVVEQGIHTFSEVIYIAAQDSPLTFNDRELVDNIRQTDKVTFLYINPFTKKNSQ